MYWWSLYPPLRPPVVLCFFFSLYVTIDQIPLLSYQLQSWIQLQMELKLSSPLKLVEVNWPKKCYTSDEIFVAKISSGIACLEESNILAVSPLAQNRIGLWLDDYLRKEELIVCKILCFRRIGGWRCGSWESEEVWFDAALLQDNGASLQEAGKKATCYESLLRADRDRNNLLLVLAPYLLQKRHKESSEEVFTKHGPAHIQSTWRLSQAQFSGVTKGLFVEHRVTLLFLRTLLDILYIHQYYKIN